MEIFPEFKFGPKYRLVDNLSFSPLTIVCGSPRQERISTVCSLLKTWRKNMDRIIVVTDNKDEFDTNKIQRKHGIYLNVDQLFGTVTSAYNFLAGQHNDALESKTLVQYFLVVELSNDHFRAEVANLISELRDFSEYVQVSLLFSIANPNGLCSSVKEMAKTALILRDPTIFYDKWAKYWHTLTGEDLDEHGRRSFGICWNHSIENSNQDRNTALVFDDIHWHSHNLNEMIFYPIYHQPQDECKLVTILKHVSPLCVPIPIRKIIVSFADDVEYVPNRA
jgi:hypothetical protein